MEIFPKRHKGATTLLAALVEEAKHVKDPNTGEPMLHNEALGRARLIEGDFVKMWDEVKDCTVIYFNNYGGWFTTVSQTCTHTHTIRNGVGFKTAVSDEDRYAPALPSFPREVNSSEKTTLYCEMGGGHRWRIRKGKIYVRRFL